MPTLSRYPVGPSKADAMRVTRELRPDPTVNRGGITSFGNVQSLPGYDAKVNTAPSSFTVTLDNSAGVAAADYVVGDPTGGLASLLGGVILPPDATSSGFGVAGLNASFGFAPVLINGINYSATSGPAQFGQNFQFVQGDVNGNLQRFAIIPAEAQRNTAFNANLLTLEFANPYRLDWNGALFVTVAAAQTVTLTCFVLAADDR